MGNVAVIAASYLVQQLGMSESAELEARGHFDVNEVEVKDGIVQPLTFPRGVFFHWKNPGAGRDLIVFLAETQPAAGSYDYANELLNTVKAFDIERVVTFASLASGLHPSENPKVSGVATDAATLGELERAEVTKIADGQIGGLNGLVLGVAAQRGLSGLCLLAEIPYFAARVPNPKAARAALSVFSILAGIDISLEALNRQAAVVDRAILEAMEKAKRQAETGDEGDEDEHEGLDAPGLETDETTTPAPPTAPSDTPPTPSPSTPGFAPTAMPKLDPGERERIEALFDAVKRDPTQGMRLKNELDRLGVFPQYEGRFLDLFKKRAG
jgi:proteasome assembly chaperone (PAC2) family protein